MQWIDLTSEKMRRAVKETGGVCLLPTGCMERHGPHLPLGTDQFVGDAVARRAAEIEPAVVFPSYYFGQIAEARHCPGTFSLPNELVLKLLLATLDEIGRNGFKKIIIVNCHGGNNGLLDYLLFTLLQKPRDYVIYRNPREMTNAEMEQWAEMRDLPDGHAGEGETSLITYLRPDTVDMDSVIGPEDWRSRGWQKHLKGARNPMWWYADHPTHISGDPTKATAEKGKFLLDCAAQHLAEFIGTVKADDVTLRLQRDYHEKAASAGLESE